VRSGGAVVESVVGCSHLTPELGFDWYGGIMRVTMDRVGRIVVPKPLRDQLGVGADSEFDIELDGLCIRLEPRAIPTRQVSEIDGWPVLRAVHSALVTDADVRALRDAAQR